MFLLYVPADCIAILFLAYILAYYPQLPKFLQALEVASLADSHLQQQQPYYRLLAVAAAFSIHFSERILEVLFLHRFSGTASARDTFTISMLYTSAVACLLYTQVLSLSLPAPTIDLKALRASLFLKFLPPLSLVAATKRRKQQQICCATWRFV